MICVELWSIFVSGRSLESLSREGPPYNKSPIPVQLIPPTIWRMKMRKLVVRTTVPKTVHISPEQYVAFEEIKQQTGKNHSTIIREALDSEIERAGFGEFASELKNADVSLKA